MLQRNTKDMNERKSILCPWIRLLHIIKMSFLPKLAYNFNVSLTKMSSSFVIIIKLSQKCMWKNKQAKIVKSGREDNQANQSPSINML